MHKPSTSIVSHAAKDGLIVRTMHPSLVRMYELALEEGIRGPVALAKRLEETKQAVSNWRGPGVSNKGAMKAQRLCGWSAAYIMTGEGPKRVDPTISEVIGSPVPIPKEMLCVSAVVGSLILEDSSVVLREQAQGDRYILVISKGVSKALQAYEVGFSHKRARKGDFLVVDAGRTPENLDDVLVWYYDAKKDSEVWAFERFTGRVRDGDYCSFEGDTLEHPHIVPSKDIRKLLVLVAINPPHSLIPEDSAQ